MEIKKQLVQHLRKYTEVEEKEVQPILSYFRTITVGRKENLQEAGKLCRYHYFVGKGCLRMFFINEKGNEQTSQFAIENWWLTDHLSFSHQRETEFFIQSVERSELLAIDFNAQEQMFKAHPCVERYFRKIYEIAYGAMQRGKKFQYDLSGEERYLHFITAYPDFVNRVPQYLIASFLDITPEYLSEIKKRRRDSATSVKA
jgi:CRP-like cAMP-binding protein